VNKTIEWTTRAKDSLDHYCSIIEENSLLNSRKVRKEIVLTSKKLSKNPYLYQLDEYYPEISEGFSSGITE